MQIKNQTFFKNLPETLQKTFSDRSDKSDKSDKLNYANKAVGAFRRLVWGYYS